MKEKEIETKHHENRHTFFVSNVYKLVGAHREETSCGNILFVF